MDNNKEFISQFVWVEELEQFKPKAWVEAGGLEELNFNPVVIEEGDCE